ncbi:hypothetical protein HOF40_02155 [Candidatus Parcubacteria bacterium]|jgi:hypothetical protein|nr:hypothetical protein [Candidatus Parcubacteria bacterium]MBT3948867.1 hypothetical protein [Candidatus Parcubacteria bacterium]
MSNIPHSTFHILKIFLFILFFAIPLPSFAQSVELAVPFSPQAPDGIWTEPWRTACEETSTMLIEMFYFGYSKEKVDASVAKKKIELLVSLENKYLGLNKDNNAKQIVEIINKFLPWEAYVVKNPTLDQIKKRNR